MAASLSNLSKRERLILLVTLGAIAFYLLDAFAIDPYLQARQSAAHQLSDATQKLHHSKDLLAAQPKLEKTWKTYRQQGLASDPSEAANKVQHALYDFERASGVELTLVKPDNPLTDSKDHNFIQVLIHAAGKGSMASIARFIYSIETTTLPIRISDLNLRGMKEETGTISFQLTVSTIVLSPSADRQENYNLAMSSHEDPRPEATP